MPCADGSKTLVEPRVNRMLKTLGIVDACYGSSPARARASRRIGGKSVLEWVVRRATDSQQLDGVLVVTSGAAENGVVARLVPSDVPVFVGPKSDPLSCLRAALDEYRCESVVRIGSHFPFVDPMLLDRLVIDAEGHPDCDYLSYCCRNGQPAILAPVGLYAEWFRSKALQRVAKMTTAEPDRQSVTGYFYAHPEQFNLRLIPVPDAIDREDVRLTVDIEEDWENTLTIFEALGPEELDWQRIAELLDHQPALRKRMAALNRVHASA